jgi:hypothetical protein
MVDGNPAAEIGHHELQARFAFFVCGVETVETLVDLVEGFIDFSTVPGWAGVRHFACGHSQSRRLMC